MEKVITIGDKELTVKSTAGSLFRYKANFKRDGVKDLLSLAKGIEDDKKDKGNNEENDKEKILRMLENESFSLDVFYNFLWVFAKTANDSIPPIEKWLDEFDLPPLDFVTEALPQILPLLFSAVKTTVKPKN